MPLDPQTSDLLRKLGGAAIEREREAQEPFPPKWDPSNPDHPNPLEMVAFPGLRKPERASSPLIEATHKAGRRFTIWANYNLLTALSLQDPRKIGNQAQNQHLSAKLLGKFVEHPV